ncbi:uncharacterized protein LOC110990263 [Acanthaster planci]|uniref:Uncharacterized protein LOC110990263 n=1 Tax=Acanthaster planci TaxID=133434 RepID=A0A8B7ZZI7_ACAPL|nr:uncharacterized protein LOC110990263 [Acanthaster planci]
MGCVASAVAREKSKGKVQPVPSPKTLRGDLISRNEARQRRNTGIADHQAKASEHAKTIVYSTLAEKEMMSTTSTERSYRSGRAFLISAAASIAAENNGTASEQGSSSTVSDGNNPLKPEQQGAPTRNKSDAVKATSTRLPYAVPEEESLHPMHGSADVKGQEASLQNGDVKVNRTGPEESRDETGMATDEGMLACDKNAEKDIHSGTDGSSDEQEVTMCQEAALDSQASQIDGNYGSKGGKPSRVHFAETRAMDIIKSEEDSIREDERTNKPTENGSLTAVEYLPAG